MTSTRKEGQYTRGGVIQWKSVITQLNHDFQAIPTTESYKRPSHRLIINDALTTDEQIV